MTNQKESFITSTCHKKEKPKAKAKRNDKADRNENGTFADGHKFSVGCGRPPMFKKPEDLRDKIDEYINNCPDHLKHIDNDGAITEIVKPILSGMAFFLGFESRQSMYDYEDKGDQFSYIIKRARLWIEMQYEIGLQGKSPTGFIFGLKNMEWKDKTEVDNTHKFTGQAPIAFGDTSKAKK